MDGRALRYQHRRPQLLAAAAEYVLDHGIGDLSLRPMARALGVTHATLIRHFSSKEALLAEVVEHLRAELLAQIETDPELEATSSVAELLRALWRRFSDPKEQRQFLLLAEIYGQGVRDPGRFGNLLESIVHDFIAPIEERLIQDGWPRDRAPAVATVLLAQVRGLQLDLAATGDRERVDAAFAVILDALGDPVLGQRGR
ncbi:MAG: TetR/AcrR family transcriptional regulator [Actinobacteria bacterium]|nr:MAG: TetR/AcrR family transcriptional regulator [Actinomycetota bacterium]